MPMWDRVMDVLKVAAIPITVALAGYFIQQAMQDDQLRTERLKLAISLLANTETPTPLKQFAVDLLNDSLPDGVTLSKGLTVSLATGEVAFPLTFADFFVKPKLSPEELKKLWELEELRSKYREREPELAPDALIPMGPK
jgi:hypothetical protein